MMSFNQIHILVKKFLIISSIVRRDRQLSLSSEIVTKQ